MAPAALAEALPKVPDRHLLLATILAELAPVLDRFAAEGFAALRDDWQALYVWQGAPGQCPARWLRRMSGRCLGADIDGALPDRYDPWHRALPVGRSFLAGGLNDRRHRRRQQPDKGGLHDGRDWAACGVLATADVAWLKEAVEDWPKDALVVVCNVAGSRSGVKSMPCSRDCSVRPFISARRPNAVTCSMATTRHRSLAPTAGPPWSARGFCERDCLVVCAGTATTIDRLDADGRFVGGVILPGFDLMRSALAGNTAQLPLAEGELRAVPTNTMDAIISGCLNAQLGAIERLFAPLADSPGPAA